MGMKFLVCIGVPATSNFKLRRPITSLKFVITKSYKFGNIVSINLKDINYGLFKVHIFYQPNVSLEVLKNITADIRFS